MNTGQQLSWANFRETVFVAGQQRTHRAHERPLVEIFGDGIGNRLGAIIEIGGAPAIPGQVSALAFVDSRLLPFRGKKCIELVAKDPELFRPFYYFVCAVSERIAADDRDVLNVILDELSSFEALLRKQALLGAERQTGLLGELLFLEHLVQRRGLNALDAWIGPSREPHDFRIADFEFEVKTTTTTRRIHTINGLDQLVPSKDCALAIASIMIGPAGDSTGFSLASTVEGLSTAFAASKGRAAQFSTAIEKCGYRSVDSQHYRRRFALRRPLAIALVNDRFPAITRPTIERALGGLAPRVEDLSYDVDVEGLVHEEHSKLFTSVLDGATGKA